MKYLGKTNSLFIGCLLGKTSKSLDFPANTLVIVNTKMRRDNVVFHNKKYFIPLYAEPDKLKKYITYITEFNDNQIFKLLY